MAEPREGRCTLCHETTTVRYVKKLHRRYEQEPIGVVVEHEIWLCAACSARISATAS